MTRPELAVVVLAAGKGVRMKTALPKVLHAAAGTPLLGHVLATSEHLGDAVGAGPRIVVIGAGRETVGPWLTATAPAAIQVVQDPPRGTGDALKVASAAFGAASQVLVLSGDVPLLKAETLKLLVGALERPSPAAVAFLTAKVPDPGEYGRVVRDGSGEVLRIVEAKDATEAERQIDEMNAGVYVFDRDFLDRALPLLTAANAQGEYYLTDLVGIAVAERRRVVGVEVADAQEVLGVNSRRDLAEVDAILRRRAADAALDAGATLLRPETITLDATVVVEPDAVLEPFTTLTGVTRVGTGARIGQGSVIADSAIGARAQVRPYCVIDRAVVGEGAVVGPFARLREGTELGPDVHVGNFVETKKARLARGAKANHLTYLGDVVIGERTNVGAGTITCNYDGFEKHLTRIGAGVFVGSDVQLVAPVSIGDGAIIGAGTTVTKDVPADSLALSRTPQTVVPEGGAAYRRRRQAAKDAKQKGS
jgi:bifunctional UDP-N-acetylglucosamine pyrophosphorylase/glucosamine-1-phosphate N-acetyltransferase